MNHVQATEKAHFNQLYTHATFLYQTKRYSDTIAYAQKALAILPEDPRPYAIIALAMAYMKNPEAPEWAKKAIARDPTNGTYRGCLANTYTIRGRWKEGLAPMREAVSLSPENADLQSGLGLCLFRTRKFREALPYLQKSVELDPQNAYYHVRLSNALLRLRDWKGADTHLQKALALKPDDTIVQAALGWRLRARGLGSEADETFREALRLNPRNPVAKVGLGESTGKRKGPIDAVLRFSILIVSVRHRKALGIIQWLALFGFLAIASPYVDPLQGVLTSACFLIWVTYFSLAGLVVKIIGERRGVHFF
jgi:tetratricopeptide (TPR) repeat protein